MIRILIVEDDEVRVSRIREWLPPDVLLVWAKSAGTAIGMIKRDGGQTYGGIMLDHDLFQKRITQFDYQHNGKDVVQAVVQNIDPDVPVFVHSTNVSEGPRMAQVLAGAGFAVEKTPFNTLTKNIFDDWISYVRDSV